MGYIEETGAAQHLRDARIAPIYEGTNGIQAADLVGRKIGLEAGAVLARLLGEVKAGGDGTPLHALALACERVAARLQQAGTEDRLAASYPFLTMMSVAVSGWLMALQAGALAAEEGLDPAFAAMKRAAITFYLDQIVPEALGLEAAASAPADILYSMPEDAFVSR
jgi:hypothetical protein